MKGAFQALQKGIRQASIASSDKAFDLLPLLPSLFLTLAASAFAAKVMPLALIAPLGLALSYLLGPAGFGASLALLAVTVFSFFSSLSFCLANTLFIASTIVSWWLGSLSSEHYQQRVEDLKEMITTLFKKNQELEMHAKNVVAALAEERKHLQQQKGEWQARIHDLEEQLSGYKHHLSLSWQEASDLKEELQLLKKSEEDKLYAAEGLSLMHLQQKLQLETLLQQERKAYGDLVISNEKKQNDFLEEFSLLKERIQNLEGALKEKEEALVQTMQELSCGKERVQENPSVDRDLKLLREQFEEKSLVLDNTRRELFHWQQQAMSKDKEYTEKLFDDEGSAMESLTRQYCLLASYCQELEEEISLLEGLAQQTGIKSKEPKKKSAPSAMYDLLDSGANLFNLS